MRILITGATGFIGQQLLRHFCSLGHSLAIHCRNKPREIDPRVLVFAGALHQFQKEISAFSPEYVFHLAGSSVHPKNTEEEGQIWSANVLYGNTLLGIVKEIPNLVFVNFTTSLAYAGTELHPFNYFALTKANFVQSLEYHVRFHSLRVFNLILYTIYGKGDLTKRAINYIIESLNAKEPISMSPGEQQLDFVHVDDVILLCEELLKNNPQQNLEHLHVGTGRGTTLKEAVRLIEHLSNQKANIHFGALPYRKEEKMVNIAPVSDNRFWQTHIEIETGFLSLI